ncbi:MAG TPA: HD domain-containing protein [Treponema sp.]|nr:HD domain-containing protein [Treponema sp.]
MKNFSVQKNSDDLLELQNRFSLDELDQWHTSSGLIESVISMIKTRFPEMETHVFVHVPEAREYREIDREGLASIPDDSLFTACLAMTTTGTDLSSFFEEYLPDEAMLRILFELTYGGFYFEPVVHRFSLLGFIMLCAPGLTGENRIASDEQKEFLAEIASRLKINLYAASIADRRQRELLSLSGYPALLHKRLNVKEVSQHLLDDLAEKIPFDCGVYYEYDEYNQLLIPVVWSGIQEKPKTLSRGEAISGKTLERKRAVFVQDRTKHPSFSMNEGEEFLSGSFITTPVQTDKRVFGVVTIARKSGSTESFGMEHRYTLEIAMTFVASEINNRLLYDELEQSYFSTVAALTRALEAKDHYTCGHSERVMNVAVGISQTLNLSPETIRRIRYAAILHDIGKIGISDTIICKPTRLTDVEYTEIKRHTEIGYDIMNEKGFFGEIRDLIRYHHEKMDGSGYYSKQTGDYPWEAMIISLADIYDALTSDRPYRSAFTSERAVLSLQQLVGVSFDQKIFNAFCTWLKEEKNT